MVTDEPRTATASTSFEAFYLAEFPRLVPMLQAWCGDRPTAEDLAQDALVQAEQRWDTVSALDNPGTWVRRVALNRSSNEGRRRRRERRAVRLATSRAVVELTTSAELRDQALWVAVRDLPANQRAAVVLRYVDDLLLADIAAVLECSEGTVKTHLQRARATLAGRLAPDHREDPR